ncbi:MAG: universal stress protein [Alphaproteobacteria bacterium]
MTFKSILVYTDRGTSAKIRLALAGKLAENHNAYIVGLAVRQTQIYPMGFVEIIPQDVINSISAQTEEAIVALHGSFEAAMAACGLSANSEWRDATGDPSQRIAVHGRYSDLIIIGQPDPDVQFGLATELADDVLLQAGRPILVIPDTQKEADIGKRIMVAWNGSREAARAVADAMPLLKRAASVDVVSANPDDIGDDPGADIGHFLARHGVTVEVSHTLTDGISIGDELLNRTADRNTDILVMGGYGHSRFRETVLGGATRHILRHMTVPTLLSR